jgi:uncharacterized protein YbgA (DUF1722 family)
LIKRADRENARSRAAWARWSDPDEPPLLAVDRDPAEEEGPVDVGRWVDRVPGGEVPDGPDVDGVLLTPACDAGTAAALAARFPEAPVHDGRRPRTLEEWVHFLEVVFALNRWRARCRAGTPVLEFHEAHDLLLRVHGEDGAQDLAQLARSEEPRSSEYGARFRLHLARPADRGDVLRVLRLALAEIRSRLAPRDRRALRLAVEDFGRGTLPRVAPRTLLRHHARSCGDESLTGQLFLDPYPAELERGWPARTDERAW